MSEHKNDHAKETQKPQPAHPENPNPDHKEEIGSGAPTKKPNGNSNN